MRPGWRKVSVGELGRVVTGKTPRTVVADNYGGTVPFLTPSDDMNVKHAETTGKKLTASGLSEVKNRLLPPRSICVSCIGYDLGKVVMTTQETITNQQINSIIPAAGVDADFVYYAMRILGRELSHISKTSTAVPIVNKSAFSNYTIALPDLPTQRVIAATLSCLDEKIANNTKINHRLKQMAQAMFKSWFVDFEPWNGEQPPDWRGGSLLDIADYRNGLAMQRFRPAEGEAGLPVLKIKALRQGVSDLSGERCSPNIRSDCVVRDGDVIFSWSGSLLVDFWCGGDCGLNQHLFKVTSRKYDKWFYYGWLCHHLDQFIAMASDKKTTLGHIKREALGKAEVLIPAEKDYAAFGAVLAPLYEQIIDNRIENRKIALLRDSLLPRLMSGRLSVADLDANDDLSPKDIM